MKERTPAVLQVVWFKRDLRVHDHRPLDAAARHGGPVLPLYMAEPAMWSQPDRSERHRLAVASALHDLEGQLRRLGSRLVVAPGEALETLTLLRQRFGHFRLLSHEETGNDWTFRRDLDVLDWCRAHGVEWIEWRQFGVVRRLRRRDGWAGQWDRMMAEPLTPPPRRLPEVRVPAGFAGVEGFADPPPDSRPAPAMQVVTRQAAVADLESFLRHRAEGYRVNMSSPLRAEAGGSRLSVHLSLGTLAMREAWQAARRRRERERGRSAEARGTWNEDLQSFEGRLHWHCHFMQKLESDPRIEFENMSQAVDGLRENAFSQHYFSTWCNGQTGYPYVDACMRYLKHTGWLNFRARAMLMSFASYDLWLPWREPALHLARLFLDYEPGIHYPQVQMQSGTTGINSVRIYNPVKQGQDHDPDGSFIARWVPELAALPARYRHEPWAMTPIEREASAVAPGRGYPERVVDHAAAARSALAAIRSRRRAPAAREEAAAIHRRHGSRRRR